MPEFRIEVEAKISDQRRANRNRNKEGMLALRAIVIEAPDEPSAKVRAIQVMEVLSGR